ncbi:MAG TPA: hypothetical protein VIU12_11230 [Chryseolinea sp.]
MQQISENSIKITFAIGIFVLGLIVPFNEYLVVIEAFYLIIPLSILFLASLIYLTAGYFLGHSKHTLYMACLIPLFIVSQLISTYVVPKIQRARAEMSIEEIESALTTTGRVPDHYCAPFGIKFQRLDGLNDFEISYSSGFLVREVYEGRLKSWKSYGWND